MKFLLVALVFAAAVYLLVRFIQARAGRAADVRRHPSSGGRPAQRRPLGPDDDPDFLRQLDRRRRRKKDEPET